MSEAVIQAGGMLKASYPTDLTDAQGILLQPMLPKPSTRGRPWAEARACGNQGTAKLWRKATVHLMGERCWK